MGAYAPHAALIAARIRRKNPIVGGIITADLGLVAGTPTVAVRVGDDAVRYAVYTPPLAVQVGKWVFVTRTGASLASPLVVVTTNYQAGGGGGLGTGPLGTGPLGG